MFDEGNFKTAYYWSVAWLLLSALTRMYAWGEESTAERCGKCSHTSWQGKKGGQCKTEDKGFGQSRPCLGD